MLCERLILRAFGKLLEKKAYEHITVQEIIDEADVGRSTFYAHFETKDELLLAMCTDIFHHVFTQALPKEAEEDYSSGSKNLELKLGHVLFHLNEHRSELSGILSGESAGIFMNYFRSYIKELFEMYMNDFKLDVPPAYLLEQLVGSFAETVKWWIGTKNEYSSEQMAEFFMRIMYK